MTKNSWKSENSSGCFYYQYHILGKTRKIVIGGAFYNYMEYFILF